LHITIEKTVKTIYRFHKLVFDRGYIILDALNVSTE